MNYERARKQRGVDFVTKPELLFKLILAEARGTVENGKECLECSIVMTRKSLCQSAHINRGCDQ
jgi:hypothetical protein